MPPNIRIEKAMTDLNPQKLSAWINLIGISEGGIKDLKAEALEIIKSSDFVFGGVRHLELLKDIIKNPCPWPSPFDLKFQDIQNVRGKKVAVIASNNPFFYGVGTSLLRVFDAQEIYAIPAPSSFSLAASILKISLQDTECLSLHNFKVQKLWRYLMANKKILALTTDQNSPKEIAEFLSSKGFGNSKLIIIENMGGENQKQYEAIAQDFNIENISPLHIVYIEVLENNNAIKIPYGFGIDDDFFLNDGQITKKEVRTLTLNALRPQYGQTLWDIGAGSGSISIEWCLLDKSLKAISIEQNEKRAENIKANFASFGLKPDLRLGKAEDIIDTLPEPDAIFFGGGVSKNNILEQAISKLKSGGIIVVNCVVLESQAVIIEAFKKYGGDLKEIAISNLYKIGTMHGLKPAMPILQWSYKKP